MRIRKRFPPSSLPLSDPQLNRPPVVQHPTRWSIQVYPDRNLCLQTGSQPSDPPNQALSPPSDHQPMTGSENTIWVCSDTSKEREVKQKDLEGEEVKEIDRWRKDQEKSNDIRKGGILGAEVGSEVLPPSGSSHQEGERWCEGEKVVPLKKRKGGFERRSVSEEMIIMEKKKKKLKAKILKSKMNKKCALLQNDVDDHGEQEGKETRDKNTKKIKRGSVIMEGSRCSRVNGRGWRCCQQTLVGYSLCEHHLGKGRLRSMTSVRSRAMAKTSAAPKKDDDDPQPLMSSSLEEKTDRERILLHVDNDEDDEELDEKKPSMVITKKRMKLGMVKARSISSLLGQTNNAVVRNS